MTGETNKPVYYALPAIGEDYINTHGYACLFETVSPDAENYTSYIFKDPVDIIKVTRPSGIRSAFEKIEKYSQKYYLAGYFSYELGYFLEPDLFSGAGNYRFPLIQLCVFDKVVSFNHRTGEISGDSKGIFRNDGVNAGFTVSGLNFNLDRRAYAEKIRKIKKYIVSGQTYQVNFTGRYNFRFSGSALSFYGELKNAQRVAYSAFCKFKDEYIISLSPELFLRREGDRIYSRPMKGTLKRGFDSSQDEKRADELKNSLKDRAENIMVVDLIRNDLGRISKEGSVRVKDAFRIEKYDTLFQMTSTVESRLRKGVSYFEIIKSLFPGGSVTGAPKIRTMQIIKELEKNERGVYCGALGIISPCRRSVFNLPIRTVCLKSHKGVMGVGSGIVIDSDPGREFAECLLKAKFLKEEYKEFKLLETILWDRGYRFLKEHLSRLKDSADYFDFSFPKGVISGRLAELEDKLSSGHKYKVRLLLGRSGGVELKGSLLEEGRGASRSLYAAISKKRVNRDNVFLYHKTTNRALYDSEYARYALKGCYDVLFLNESGEVTEGAISNIVVEKKGRFFTPALSCGLLPGIYRNYLIRSGKLEERIIGLKELLGADRVLLCNSVRGIKEVKILSAPWHKGTFA